MKQLFYDIRKWLIRRLAGNDIQVIGNVSLHISDTIHLNEHHTVFGSHVISGNRIEDSDGGGIRIV